MRTCPILLDVISPSGMLLHEANEYRVPILLILAVVIIVAVLVRCRKK
jgi:hypothetical protein